MSKATSLLYESSRSRFIDYHESSLRELEAKPDCYWNCESLQNRSYRDLVVVVNSIQAFFFFLNLDSYSESRLTSVVNVQQHVAGFLSGQKIHLIRALSAFLASTVLDHPTQHLESKCHDTFLSVIVTG